MAYRTLYVHIMYTLLSGNMLYRYEHAHVYTYIYISIYIHIAVYLYVYAGIDT